MLQEYNGGSVLSRTIGESDGCSRQTGARDKQKGAANVGVRPPVEDVDDFGRFVVGCDAAGEEYSGGGEGGGSER